MQTDLLKKNRVALKICRKVAESNVKIGEN